MIGLLIAQLSLSASFSPSLLFVGESFNASISTNAVIQDQKGVRLNGHRGFIQSFDASFWLVKKANGGLVDATEIFLPVACIPRWQSWPETSGQRGGAAFLVSEACKVAIVPTRLGHGLCVLQNGSETRFANLASLDIEVRSGPRHERVIRADALVAGSQFATLYAKPDNVARVWLRVWPGRIDAVILAEYEMRGVLKLLNTEFPIQLSKGSLFRTTYSFLN